MTHSFPTRRSSDRVLRRGVQQRKVIGRNVRIREASVRVSDLTTLDHVFETLEETFAQDEFECAEVRLRRSFVGSGVGGAAYRRLDRSEEHTSELQSIMRNSYAVFFLKKKKK